MAETPDPRADARPTVNLPATPPAPGGGDVVAGPVGDYEILGEIERGGMGVVYRARERHSGRLVALKMMLPAGDGDRHRFILEARATGELNHPGIVAIHTWGEHQGHPFYTMDFVPGVTLSRLLAPGPLPCRRAVRYLLGIAQAVGAAHAVGTVHRDLKPANVIIDLSDQPRVLDFGLAKRLRAAPAPAESAVADVLPADAPLPPAELARRTEKGAILGTPSYMAPEQVRAEHDRVGPEADVHALGAMFYEMVTGRPPFHAESTYETLTQVLQRQPEPLRAHAPRVPATLEEFCRRCLEKEPRRRYPNAGALAEDLERRWHRWARAARCARLAAAAALALALLAGLGFLLGGAAPVLLERLATGLAEAAPASTPVRQAAPTLAVLLWGVFLVLGGYLAELGLAAWLAAWAWNDDRPGRIVLGCTLAAGLAAALSFLPGLGFLAEGPLYPAWLLLGNAVAVAGVVAYRRLSRADRPPPEARRSGSDPYLEKLFVARSDARPRSAAGARGAAGLADFELGKTLYRWDDHEVRWARQKSLDRATLAWLDRAPPPGRGVPGVVVRHPSVLGLHAVGTTAEGSYLVTEPAAASPLGEVLGQRGLVPAEAAALAVRLARAVQAFHDQGACHGRLGPDWVLVRGDLEPLLCPCGFPSQSAEDRRRDVQALGRLLREWLPAAPRGWQRHLLAPLYRVADAASAGECGRAGDLADDVEAAVRQVQRRWYAYWGHALALALLVAPLLLPPAARLLHLAGVLPAGHVALGGLSGNLAGYLLLALAPCAGVLGYTQARALVHGWRGRHGGRGVGLRYGLGLPLAEVLLLAAAAGPLAWLNVPAEAGAPWPGLLLVAAEFVGFWALGVGLAALVTFAELLARSLQAVPAGRGS